MCNERFHLRKKYLLYSFEAWMACMLCLVMIGGDTANTCLKFKPYSPALAATRKAKFPPKEKPHMMNFL